MLWIYLKMKPNFQYIERDIKKGEHENLFSFKKYICI